MAIAALLGSDTRGILHVTNEGACSWHEFAREIVTLGSLQQPKREFATYAARPEPSPQPVPGPGVAVGQ